MTDIPADIQEMSFEAAMGALEQIVSKLESGQAPLEDSIDLYTRGTLLKKHCEAKLASAQSRIEKLTLSNDGPTGSETFESD
ncbi:exodeoxyribonuclease VII small subunit [Temperatibacter marinus]|uniref:Exodeoxyribonuclease 7 small subunit n=1 Tax=Temperatibacter marinus TaxID=1456591 RepID=A0AA52EGK2_9PROT|nr:exodeoxyribonuclease VII small subunit [Temperatibacter marinus]WND01934.1 exodeoxyribonuclease VII small subunit [Temperatibacter marinus]